MSGITGLGGLAVGRSQLDPSLAPPPRPGPRPPGGGVPPPSGSPVPAGDIPVLSQPQMFDASELMEKYLALKTKMGDAEVKSSMEEVGAQGKVRKEKNNEVAKKMEEAIEKQKEAKAGGLAAKIFGWIALAFTVIASIAVSIASFGTMTGVMALATAAVAVTMATLNETGVMEKMTEAIKDSLIQGGMSEDDASKWAMGLTIAIQIGVSLATIAGGAAASASTAANIASGVVRVSAKTAELASTVANVARGASAATTVVQQGVAIGTAVKTKEAADATAGSMELKKFLAKLQAAMQDEMDRIQQMVQQAQASISTAMKVLSGQTNTSGEIIRHMGTRA